jgi:cysteine desulfurase
VDGTALTMHLDLKGVAASSASACKTGNPEPSDVLLAMGYPHDLALGSLRLTVGMQTKEADVEFALIVLVESVEKVRRLKITTTAEPVRHHKLTSEINKTEIEWAV